MGIDLGRGTGDFYDRVCASICRSTPFVRAVFLAWDSGYQAVLPAGSHGVDKDLLSRIEGSLDETPIAQRAFAEDRVVIVSGPLSGHVPERYAEIVEEETLACAPVQASGEWLGVIVADLPEVDVPVNAEEVRLIETLARLAALAFSVERGTSQRERSRRLAERIALTRDVHERVIQRLFATSLALGVDGPLDVSERERCESEVRLAISELRSALARPAAGRRQPTTTLEVLLSRLVRSDPAIEVAWQPGLRLDEELEAIAQAVVNEAIANARKHADPSLIQVVVGADGDALVLEVRNDGVTDGRSAGGTGLGLRLVAFEALDRRGVVEFGPLDDGGWHVRLVAPREGGPA
jgi:signal transduction histidine kinase